MNEKLKALLDEVSDEEVAEVLTHAKLKVAVGSYADKRVTTAIDNWKERHGDDLRKEGESKHEPRIRELEEKLKGQAEDITRYKKLSEWSREMGLSDTARRVVMNFQGNDTSVDKQLELFKQTLLEQKQEVTNQMLSAGGRTVSAPVRSKRPPTLDEMKGWTGEKMSAEMASDKKGIFKVLEGK